MTRPARWLILSSLLALQSLSLANDLAGRVVGVVDGDTLDVLKDGNELVRVRLSGIDAPERHQPFGQVAKKSLSDLAFNQRVIVDWKTRDRYGRVIGKVLVAGLDTNLQMVKQGLAWHYKKYQKEQPQGERLTYARAEDAARASRVGLWVDTEPTAPWDFRERKRDGRGAYQATWAGSSCSRPWTTTAACP